MPWHESISLITNGLKGEVQELHFSGISTNWIVIKIIAIRTKTKCQKEKKNPILCANSSELCCHLWVCNREGINASKNHSLGIKHNNDKKYISLLPVIASAHLALTLSWSAVAWSCSEQLQRKESTQVLGEWAGSFHSQIPRKWHQHHWVFPIPCSHGGIPGQSEAGITGPAKIIWNMLIWKLYKKKSALGQCDNQD